MKLKYSDLTSKEKAIICNGCGGKGSIINPPNFMFTASCNHHDFNYWRGGTEVDRLKADWRFLKAMLRDSLYIENLAFFISHIVIACLYFIAVRIAGWNYFNYGKYKTLKDLKKECEEIK